MKERKCITIRFYRTVLHISRSTCLVLLMQWQEIVVDELWGKLKGGKKIVPWNSLKRKTTSRKLIQLEFKVFIHPFSKLGSSKKTSSSSNFQFAKSGKQIDFQLSLAIDGDWNLASRATRLPFLFTSSYSIDSLVMFLNSSCEPLCSLEVLLWLKLSDIRSPLDRFINFHWSVGKEI